MSCSIIPYQRLGGNKQTGGTWKLISGGPVPLLINGATNTQVFSNGNPIPGDHTLTIDFSQTPATALNAPIVLEYTVGNTAPCVDTALVTINVLPKAKAGLDRSITKCSSDNFAYNLFNLISGGNGQGGATTTTVDTDGVWSGSGTSLAGYNAGSPTSQTDNTFNPSLITIPSGQDRIVATFIYRVIRTPTDAACVANCQDEATISFEVVLQPNAGTDATFTVCNSI